MGQQKQKSPLTEDEVIIVDNNETDKVVLDRLTQHNSNNNNINNNNGTDKRHQSSIIQLLANEVSLADLFDLFIEASTLRNVLAIHHRMLNYLDLNPCQFNVFFPTLKKAVLTNRVRKNWKAAAIFAKIDRRASHRCYQNNKSASTSNNGEQTLPDSYSSSHQEQDNNNNNNAMQGYNCLIVGAGPAGLRTAIELQLLGAKRVVIAEKRSRFSRNNVLHLWPFVIEDLKSLGAKKFYGKFCAGSIDHISIRQIQLILLKICLMIGCDFRDCCSFMGLCPASLNNADGTTNNCDFIDGVCDKSTENNNNNNQDDDDYMSEEGNAGIKNNHVVLLETRPSSICASPIPLIDEDDNDDGANGSKAPGHHRQSNESNQTVDDHEQQQTQIDMNNLEQSTNNQKQSSTNRRLFGSNAHFECDYPLQENELHQIKWDVIIGADGRRNTLKTFFPRKEFRGRLAIAITANFINTQTPAEAKIPEISGISYIYNQDLFKALASDTNILLENICYYKDDTHYFVMTAQKRSLLERNVLLKDFATTNDLLCEDNINRKALLEYAKDAASWTTGLEPLNFALNHYGQEDCAMFDFTSMYAASNACKALQTKDGGLVLINLVGDSLLEPFWPTGSGCARGFLSSLDTAWMCRQWAVNKCPMMKQQRHLQSNSCVDTEKNTNTSTALTNNYNIKSVLSVIAERESIYRLLAQTTSENLHQNYSHWTLNPHTRYPNLNRHLVVPSQIRNLLGYHNGISLFEDLTDDVSKSILNNLSDNNTANSSSHRSRLISPNTLSKRLRKSKLQTSNCSSSNNNTHSNNKLSIKNQNRSQCRSTSRSSSRQNSKSSTSNRQQSSILSPSPQRKRQTSYTSNSSSSTKHNNKSPSGYTDSLLEFELSYKNLTTNNNNSNSNNDIDGSSSREHLTSPIKGCSYEEIIRDYPMPLSSLSGTTPSANNLVSLEARRARDIDECLRHRREQNSNGAKREEILKRLQPTYGKRGSANALIGAAAIYRDMMRANRENGNSSDDLSGGGSVRRCASFAERVKSFENKLSESYGLSSSPTAATAAAKDKTSNDIDDIRNLPQFATLQEMFVTNSTLNNDKDLTMKKKSKMPIMKLTKDDWNVKCWEERLAKYHNKQMLYDECGNNRNSHSLTTTSGSENNSPARKVANINDDNNKARKYTRPEKQVEVFKGRIREMADKLRRPSEMMGNMAKNQISLHDRSQQQQQQHLIGSSGNTNSSTTTNDSSGNNLTINNKSHEFSLSSRSHAWVNLIKGELTGTNKRSDDNSIYSSSRHKRVIKKLFEDDDDDDQNQNEHQHYDHLCLNKPKNKYTPVNNYTSYRSRASLKDNNNSNSNSNSRLGVQSQLSDEKKYIGGGNVYKDVVESNHALTQSSSINSKITSGISAKGSSIGGSSSASSTISELSSNGSIKRNLEQKQQLQQQLNNNQANSDNNNKRFNHSNPIGTNSKSQSVCIRCKNSVATIDRVVIDDSIVHRSCLTCSKCDVRLRLNEIKSQQLTTPTTTIRNNDNNSSDGNCKQQSSNGAVYNIKSSSLSSTSSQQTNNNSNIDEAMDNMQLGDSKIVLYNFICVICQSSLRHMRQADLQASGDCVGVNDGDLNMDHDIITNNDDNDRDDDENNVVVNKVMNGVDKIKERVKSKEEFLNQQVDYSTLYKSILDATVDTSTSHQLTATTINVNNDDATINCVNDNNKSNDTNNTDLCDGGNRKISSDDDNNENGRQQDSTSCHSENELRLSSSEEQQDDEKISERVGFELSSRRSLDDDELDEIQLQLDSKRSNQQNRTKEQEEEEEEERFSISSVGSSSSGTGSSDLKSTISTSSIYDNDDLDDDEADDLSEDGSLDVGDGDDDDDDDDDDDNDNDHDDDDDDDHHDDGDDLVVNDDGDNVDNCDNVVDNSSVNSPPNTDAYGDEEEEEEEEDDDRNSTYNDFLTSEEFDYSANVSKILASPSHMNNNHNNSNYGDNTGPTNSVNSTPTKCQRSDMCSDSVGMRMSPRKQLAATSLSSGGVGLVAPPPEIVIEYHDTA